MFFFTSGSIIHKLFTHFSWFIIIILYKPIVMNKLFSIFKSFHKIQNKIPTLTFSKNCLRMINFKFGKVNFKIEKVILKKVGEKN